MLCLKLADLLNGPGVCFLADFRLFNFEGRINLSKPVLDRPRKKRRNRRYDMIARSRLFLAGALERCHFSHGNEDSGPVVRKRGRAFFTLNRRRGPLIWSLRNANL